MNMGTVAEPSESQEENVRIEAELHGDKQGKPRA
jgi:hypothetical protein